MKKLAPVLMIQGTNSDVGKSLIVTGFCRWFAQRGLRVAPFKAQNMALNSSVTIDGAEIGCAQYFQAEAARAQASALMNPILLKPEGDRNSQVVVLGKSQGTHGFRAYHEMKPALRHIILESLEELRATHDLVIIEGAGSPAEINLKANDLVNMFVALAVEAPVLLVGDIDRGGVFAALVGTLELLEPEERQRIVGFLINKFRGDPSLLRSGLDMLEERCGRPVLGVIPFAKNHGVAEEDSLALDRRPQRLRRSLDLIDIGIIRWPRLSNYDEFSSLESEEGVSLAFISEASDIEDADLVIMPGSKATISDLAWLREKGLDRALEKRLAAGRPVFAICGGYQMLGQRLYDPHGVETAAGSIAPGLGHLPTETHFAATKVTAQVSVQWLGSSWGLTASEKRFEGYEIHMGDVRTLDDTMPQPFLLQRQGQDHAEGAIAYNGALIGTLVHGLFENEAFRLSVVNHLRLGKGLAALDASRVSSRDQAYDRLADHLGQSCDMAAIARILKLENIVL